MSSIEWTDHTWNPWQGCVHVSPGCDHCYMYRDKRRYGQDPATVVRSKPPTFERPRRWNREAREAGETRMVFTASWSDFFAREADAWREEAFDLIRECESLVFQILTKRHGRIAANLPADWGDGYPNVWLGVSAENAEWWNRRVPVLRDVPAQVRFVSYEPGLGPLDGCSAEGIDWVIIGGESGGLEARPFDVAWARQALAMSRRDGAAPFVKQLGTQVYWNGVTPGGAGWAPHVRAEDVGGRWRVRLRDRKGGDPCEWPEDIRVREFPGRRAA